MKRITLPLTLLTITLAATGCKTTDPISTARYRGDPAIEPMVRAEYARQLSLVGYNPAVADAFTFEGLRLDPAGRNRDGYYGDLSGRLVHGAYLGRQEAEWVTFWFAYPASGNPDKDTVVHEVLHHMGKQCCNYGGHPTKMLLNDREWAVSAILGTGVKWPMFAAIWGAVRHPVAVWDNSGYKCLDHGQWVDGDGDGADEFGGQE